MSKLLRWCPTPYDGGTCGCGAGCTQPSDLDWPVDVPAPPGPEGDTRLDYLRECARHAHHAKEAAKVALAEAQRIYRECSWARDTAIGARYRYEAERVKR